MNYFLRIFFVLTLLCVLGITISISPVAGQNNQLTVSLQDCIQISLEENTDLFYSQNLLLNANTRIRQAKNALWPSLSLFLSDNSAINESTEFSQFDPETGQSFVPGEGFQAGVNLSYSIYNAGNRRASLQTEIDNQQILELDYRQLHRDIAKLTVQNYLAVLERQSEYTVRKEQIIQATEALNIAQNRLTQGSGIHYEVLLEEAYLAQSEADLLNSENAVKQAIRSLLLLLRLNT
ncbi:TolC family protein, partial [bacterium]|nr:TolC family protein [bacterium]